LFRTHAGDPAVHVPEKPQELGDAEVCFPRGWHNELQPTLDAGTQRIVERQIQRYIDEYGDRGIRNAAALLITVCS
jgi:hypothetical protein